MTVSLEGPEPQLPLERALGLCVDAAFVVVYRQAYRLWRGHTSNTDDLAQDVLEGLSKLAVDGNLCITGSVESFLRRTTTNRFIDQHRRRRLQTVELGESDLPADVGPTPDQLVISAEDAQILHTAIEMLPENQRLVIRLRLKDLSLSEIAEVLGEPKSTVYGQQKAAFKQLRVLIRRAGWEKES